MSPSPSGARASSWWENYVEAHPKLESLMASVQPWLPPLNFITIHYSYFIIVCLVSSVVFWGSSNPPRSISYVDSLYLVVSAMTEAGLNTVNLSSMTTWQQIILWLLIIIGSAIWVSVWTVIYRKRVFENRFEVIVRESRAQRLNNPVTLGDFHVGGRRIFPRLRRAGPLDGPGSLSDSNLDVPARPVHATSRPLPLPVDEETLVEMAGPASGPQPKVADGTGSHVTFGNAAVASQDTVADGASSSSFQAEAGAAQRRNRRSTEADATSFSTSSSPPSDGHWFHLSDILSRANVSRNSQFHDLSSEERERLGGCEYRALKMLAFLVPLYSAVWQLAGSVAMGAYISRYLPEAARVNAANPWWTGIFYAVSAFNNSGMALLDANMVPFQRSTFVLLLMGVLILAGNTAFPLFLRLTIWTLDRVLKLTTDDTALRSEKATLQFILKYPRRVYTNLFPSRPTWWLLFMLILTNCVDWVAFIVMNIGNKAIESIPPGARVLDGLFQAVAVRAGGFYVVPMSSLYIGLQLLYVIMMYISVYPVVITMRHSNVYEERSLGIYAAEDETAPPPANGAEVEPEPVPAPARPRHHLFGARNPTQFSQILRRAVTFHGVGVPKPPGEASGESRISFINHQIRGQLAHDLWWLVAAIFAIVTIETQSFLDDPLTFSVFNVIFEVVSAYGCVGISVGVPFAAFSFSGAWRTGSKLVLCVVMLRGRHRGLPVALDRAVRLPGERLARDEEEDQRIRRAKTTSRPISRAFSGV